MNVELPVCPVRESGIDCTQPRRSGAQCGELFGVWQGLLKSEQMTRKGARGGVWESQIDTDTLHYLPLDSRWWQCWYETQQRSTGVGLAVSMSVKHHRVWGGAAPLFCHTREEMSCLFKALTEEHLTSLFIYLVSLFFFFLFFFLQR